MKKFTLQEISEIMYNRYTLTEERFKYYFSSMFGWDKDKIEKAIKLYFNFPLVILNNTKDVDFLSEILEYAQKVLDILQAENISYHRNDVIKPVIREYHYKENDKVNSIEVNFNFDTQVIAYSEILRRGCEIVAVLDYVETIDYRKHCQDKGQVKVFDGDIFALYEDRMWSRRSSTVIVCNKGVFQPLLYTNGKGYMRKGEPDYDQDSQYNSYVITGAEDWRKIGNIYLNCSILIDNPKSK